MPKAIIAMVSTALTLLDLIALNATLMFSANNVTQFNGLPPAYIKELRYTFYLLLFKACVKMMLMQIFLRD
jgi:hypothetical protein